MSFRQARRLGEWCERLEGRLCNAVDCEHVGRMCEAAGCDNRVCRLHEHYCSGCDQHYCEDCYAAHLEACPGPEIDTHDLGVEQALVDAADRLRRVAAEDQLVRAEGSSLDRKKGVERRDSTPRRHSTPHSACDGVPSTARRKP